MSKEMLEAAYRGALDRQMLEQLDEAWVVACDNPDHERGATRAPHGGPATHWVVGACERNGFRCRAFVDYWMSRSAAGMTYTCLYCDQLHAYADSVFTPLVKS